MKRAALYFLYIVLIVAISTAIGLSFHSDTKSKPKIAKMPAGTAISQSHPTTPKKTTSDSASKSSSSSKSSAAANKAATDSAIAANKAAAATAATTPATSAATATNTTTAATSGLVNTGPGSVVGLFVLGFAAGSIGFSRRLRKTL